MIKKLFLITLLCCMSHIIQAAEKDTIKVGELWYEVNKSQETVKATVLKYKDGSVYSGDITIPSSIPYKGDNIPVTSISHGAFYGCNNLRSIKLPTSIDKIEKDAFKECTGLYAAEYYTLEHVFSITYGNENSNPLSYSRMLLINNQEVKSINIDCDVNDYTFCKATWLQSVTLTNNVTSIGERAFYGCVGLSGITIPNSVENIKRLAFRGCLFEEIVLPENCQLGTDVFQECRQLTTVILPKNLKEIPEATFDKCINLVDITLPTSVETIKKFAFRNCEKLTKLPISENVENIEEQAFQGCAGLESIVLPASTQYIFDDAFSGCNKLKDVYCWATAHPIATDKAFGNQQSSLALHVPEGAVADYEQADIWKTFNNIDAISDASITFYVNDTKYYEIKQQGGTDVNYSELTEPVDGIFSGWDKSLPTFMPNSDLAIYGYLTLEYKDNDKIHYYLRPAEQLNGKGLKKRAELIKVIKENADADTEIVIPSEINYLGVTYPVTTIDNDAFMFLTNLQKVTLPNSVTTIGESVFKGCTSLAEVTLPSTITTISKAMFDGCSCLSTLHSSKITTIMQQAFRYCISLSEVPSASSLTSIGNEAFKGCSSLTSVTLPANCDIGTDIFQGCNQLKTVTLPSTLTTIPDAIFDGCYKLQNITLPQNVTSIGKYAFRNCELLTILPTTNKLTTIGNQAFRGCRGLTVINLPESIESIGNEAFRDCNKLTEVYCLPSNMPEAAEDAFDTLVQSLALHVAVDASDELLRNYKTTAPWNSFKRIDATREASVITFYLNDSEHFKITQKGGTLVDATNLHEPTYGSFSGWDKEIPVFMPNNDLDIYGYLANELVYYGIKYLLHPSEKLNGKNLPRRAEMIKIEKTLSESDIQIDIADNISFNSEQYTVIAIADSAFNGQTIIQTINIPASISTIGKAAFKGCTSLTTIQLPDAITTISTSLFDGCTALTTFTLPANVTAIGDYAFRNCRSLSTLPTSTTLKTIGQGAFQNCIALTTLVMDKMTSLQAIHKEAFTGCQKVFSLTLPASLTVLEQGAFSNCPKLQDVFCLAENVPTTDPTAFGGTQENINLFVPENSLADYQAQEPWKSFATIQKNGVFTLTFYVDDKIWYQTKQMGGTIIDQSRFSTPSKGIFSGWDKDVPIIMPGRNTDIFGYVSYQKEIGDFEYQLYPAEKLNGKNLEKRAIVLRVVKKLTQNITTLQVPEEVSLEDVTYPIVQIAERVFEGSIYLERIILPTSITSIGNGVFRNCSSLKAVSNFPTTLETLSDNLFEGCRSMTQFQISENVKNIGKQAFNGCVSLKDIQLPAGLKTLGMQAFANSAIEQIVLPASLTTLGDEVFKQCRQLRQATFAEGFVQPLSRLFFWDCQALEKVTLQGTMIDIMEGAFQGCTSLTSFAIPEGIINLNSRVFKDCSNLTSITLPASLEIVGRECFSGCLAITQLTANSTQAPSANVDAFEQEVYNYAQLYVPSIEPYQEEEPWKFFRNMTVSQEYTLTYIVDGQQYKQLSLLVGSAIIPEEEPVKEGHRFSGWLQLPTVMPAKNVSVCGNFQYQIRFYENEVKESNRLLNDELYTYYYGDEVTLPAEELKRVNHWYVITGLTEDPMGEEDAEVFQSMMPANDLNLVVTYHRSEDELVLNDITYKIFVLKKYAEVVTAVKTLETVVIPDNVSYEGEDLPVLHIQANAFRDCLKLREVTLPTHLLTIGNQAFYNCSVLTSAPLPSELQSIGLQAFARTSLSEATLPASITQMDKEVFLWCSKLKSVNYQASLDTIPNRTFQNCVSLTSITLPEQVTAIDEFAFEGCSSLKDVVFSDHFTTIGEGAFKDCSAITELTLPASIETIGDKAFINVLREGDVITLLGTTLPDAVKTTFDDIAYEQALLRTQVETLTGNCWPYFQHVRLYDPSGIQSIHADQLSSDAPVYDLNGRLVAPAGSTIRLPKGIYIQRGKRILVK